MRLSQGIQLAYCTNIHRGETWEETWHGLRKYALRVRDRVCPEGGEFAIGLRLSSRAAAELAETPGAMEAFQRWLDEERCYVFTINGFPYGKFHGGRVKEQVYVPDWTTRERVDYTKLLFTILSRLAPAGAEASVSTLPGTFKEFITDEAAQADRMMANIAETAAHIESLREETGQDLHLGFEPEPLGWFETSAEAVAFFERFRSRHGDRFDRMLGVNYDTCHLAVEFEQADEALDRLRAADVRVSKLHLSSALRVTPTPDVLERLREFADDVYLHQVVVRDGDGGSGGGALRRFRDLAPALAWAGENPEASRGGEWRIHFHIPLHAGPEGGFHDTRDHLESVFDRVAREPAMCRHLEMETYTWEVLPESMRSDDVVDQLAREYEWTLGELKSRGL